MSRLDPLLLVRAKSAMAQRGADRAAEMASQCADAVRYAEEALDALAHGEHDRARRLIGLACDRERMALGTCDAMQGLEDAIDAATRE